MLYVGLDMLMFPQGDRGIVTFVVPVGAAMGAMRNLGISELTRVPLTSVSLPLQSSCTSTYYS